VTIALRHVDQPLDFMLGEIFAGPQVAVAAALGGNCSFYGGRRDQLEVRFCHVMLRRDIINRLSTGVIGQQCKNGKLFARSGVSPISALWR